MVLVHQGRLCFAKSEGFFRYNLLPTRQKQPQAGTPANFHDHAVIALRAEWEADLKRVGGTKIKLTDSFVTESFKEMNGQIFFAFTGGMPQDREFSRPHRVMFRAIDGESSRQRFAGQVAPIVRIESNVNVEANHDWGCRFVGMVGSDARCLASEVSLVG